MNNRRIYTATIRRHGENRTVLFFGRYDDYVVVTIDWTRSGNIVHISIELIRASHSKLSTLYVCI